MTHLLRNWPRLPGVWLVAGGLIIGSWLGASPVQAAPVPRPRIQKLYDTANPRQDSVFALDGYLTLEVSGLVRYMREEEARLLQRQLSPDKAHAQAQRLVLYINDAPLIGLLPESVHTVPPAEVAATPVDSAGSSRLAQPDTLTKIIFHLTRSQSTYAYWNVVYSSPWEFAHPGKIGLGYDDRLITNMYPQAGSSIRLKLVRPVALGVALVVVALLAAAIVLLARRSWLLRNAVPNWAAPNGKQPMFSLAKSQLAWWTFLVLGAYLLIYCVTGEMTDISTTTLQLLGISAGTAGLGSLIGRPASDAVVPPVSRGWWLDMLSDEQGVSIHRLQQVGFTLLLGYLFIRTVYKTVALPEWNQNEILLLGISSATYLGLKSQENKAADGLNVSSSGTPVFEALGQATTGAETVVPIAAVTIINAPLAQTEDPSDDPAAAQSAAPAAAPTEASTEESTAAPTEASTEESTAAPTEASTEESTAAPTEASTEAPTAAPTEASTEAPTEASTEAPTEASTEASIEAITVEPVAAPVVAQSTGTGPVESSADPVTGAVQYRAEDDMGPDSAAVSSAGALVLPAPIENPNLVPG